MARPRAAAVAAAASKPKTKSTGKGKKKAVTKPAPAADAAPVPKKKVAAAANGKKSGAIAKKKSNRPPRVKIDYHVVFPKAPVRALALKDFPGSIGALPLVGLTALTEQFFASIHRRAYRKKLPAFLAKNSHLKLHGKSNGEGKPRTPYSETEEPGHVLLPSGFKIGATELREVLDNDTDMIGVKKALGVDVIAFADAAVEDSAKKELEERNAAAKEIKDNHLLGIAKRNVLKQQQKALDKQLERLDSKLERLSAQVQ